MQQGGGNIAIWASIINDKIGGSVRVPEDAKLTSVSYCNLLGSALINLLEDVPLAQRKKIVFMHGNAASYSAKATTKFRASKWFMDDTLMQLSVLLA